MFKRIFTSKSVKNAAFGSILIKFGSAFFALINGVLLARYLGIDSYGYYILAFSTMTILSVPVTLGMPFLITRYISKYEVHKDYASIKGLLIKTNLLALYSILVIYFLAILTYYFWWHHYESVLVETMIFAFILLPILGYSALRAATLRGLRLVVLSELPDSLLRNFIFSAGIIISVLSDVELTPQLAIILQIAAAGIGFISGYIFLKKSLLKKLKKVKPNYLQKEWFKEALPFTLNSGVQVIKSKIINYILVIFGSIEAVAIFDVAMRGATLVLFVLDALNKAIAPFISSMYEKNDIIGMQRMIKQASRGILAFSLPVALCFIVGGVTLIEFVFGDDYGLAYIPLVILCIGQLVNALTGPVGLILSMTGLQKVYSNSNILFLTINVVLMIPSVIYFDVIGASIIFSTTLILQNIWLTYVVNKRLDINSTVF